MKIAALVAAAILATLAGCGTESATSLTTSTVPGATATATAGQPPAISALAKTLGCTRYGPDDQAGAFTWQEDACTMPGGAHVVVATFSDQQNEIAWEDSVQEQGGYIAGGRLWAASARTQALAALTGNRLHRF